MKCLSTAIVLGCISLCGCGVREANLARIEFNSHKFEKQRPVTAAEKAALIKYVKEMYFDPYTLRDIEVSSAAPVMGGTGALGEGYKGTDFLVCLKVNAKNRYGAYTGRKFKVHRFNELGVILAENEDYDFCADPQLRYGSFPELAKIMTN